MGPTLYIFIYILERPVYDLIYRKWNGCNPMYLVVQMSGVQLCLERVPQIYNTMQALKLMN